MQNLRPQIKVLFMSGYTDSGIGHQGVLDAGIAFLAKPFTPSALAGKVREVLDQVRALGKIILPLRTLSLPLESASKHFPHGALGCGFVLR